MASLYSNQPFREKFQRLEKSEGLTLAEVAHRCGWVAVDTKTNRRKPDSSRVARVLGITTEHDELRTEITEDYVIALCHALHIDYTDIDI